MAKGTKKQTGQTRARTVMKLQPVRYQITFSYLGHERIPRDNNTYRCKYTVEPGPQPGGGAAFDGRDPTRLPNVVTGATEDDAAKKASTPYDKGGDNTNPPGGMEKVYRVVIVDNHGMRSLDSSLLGRGGNPDGDTVSKPANYATVAGDKRNWLPDISPAVPLRIVVRRFFGEAQTDVDLSGLKAVVQIKDPVEEFAQATGKRRTFLEKFFKKYNRTSADPDVGDDNCPDLFRGRRVQTAGDPGVKAIDYLKTAPYKDKPKTDVPPSDPATNVQFSELGAATANGAMNAEFTFTQAEEGSGQQKFKVGVADLAFLPYPALGDNFRFLLWLVKGTQDIRDTKENGHDVELVDHLRTVIPKPRVYTTGRLILWKRTNVRMVVLVNKTQAADLNFNAVKAAYAKSFIEMIPPPAGNDGFRSLTAAQWIQELKTIFPATADKNALDAVAAAPNFDTVYGQFLYPAHLQNNKTRNELRNGLTMFVRNVITSSCTKAPRITPSPDQPDGRRQDEPDGFFLVLVRTVVNPATAPQAVRGLAFLLGASFGDRMFWFVNGAQSPGATVDATTQTFTHEMGHAQYLRHAHTKGPIGGDGGGGDNGRWQVVGGAVAPPNFDLFSSQSNNQILDHDQNDALQCLMSYSSKRTLDIVPCGLCDLTLRFYDRVNIQQPAQYEQQLMEDLKPAQILQLQNLVNNAGAVAATFTFRTPTLVGGIARLPNLSISGGTAIVVMCLSADQVYDSQSANGAHGRINLSTKDADGDSLAMWTQSSVAPDSGAVNLSVTGGIAIRITGRTRGLVNLNFSRNGVTATAQVNVVP